MTILCLFCLLLLPGSLFIQKLHFNVLLRRKAALPRYAFAAITTVSFQSKDVQNGLAVTRFAFARQIVRHDGAHWFPCVDTLQPIQSGRRNGQFPKCFIDLHEL